ncbi:proteoglycan 4-like [Pomacea canaliculata]|uniref:proteoglycan 4-like n=1 Tax=Pomacea canaliculata TaxID=400727 RepID=UPI000D7347B9|nr:proteoglycan 4-like [Pomacea canaliculata]XP_025089730.1 proteoglycan 4-like [Pomacea canaliculata]
MAEFVFRREEEWTAKDLYDTWRTSLPVLVIVNKGFYGNREELSFCTGQVLLLHKTDVQERALVYDRQGKTFSIPLDYSHYFAANDSQEEMTLRDIIVKHGVPVRIRFAESGVHTKENKSLCDTLNVVAVLQEPFFLANTVNQGRLLESVITVPLYLKEVTFCRITDLVDKTRFTSLQDFMASITEQLCQVDFTAEYGDKEMVKLSDKTVTPSANIYPDIETNVYINIKQTGYRQPPPPRPKSTSVIPESKAGKPKPHLPEGQKEALYININRDQVPHANKLPPSTLRRPPPRPSSTVAVDEHLDSSTTAPEEQKEQLYINISRDQMSPTSKLPPSTPRRPPPPVPVDEHLDSSSAAPSNAEQQGVKYDSSIYEISEPASGQTRVSLVEERKKVVHKLPTKQPPIVKSELDKALAKRRDRARIGDAGSVPKTEAEAFKCKKASEIPSVAPPGVVSLSMRSVGDESPVPVVSAPPGSADGKESIPDEKRSKTSTEKTAITAPKPSEAAPPVLNSSMKPLAMTPLKTDVMADSKEKRKIPKLFGKSESEEGNDKPKVLPKPKIGPLSFEPVQMEATSAASESTYVNQQQMALIRPTISSKITETDTSSPNGLEPKPPVTSQATNASGGAPSVEKSGASQSNCLRETNADEKPWPLTLKQMTIAQVTDVLSKLKLEKYVAKFQEEMVDGSVLSRLNDNALTTDFEMRLVEVARLRSFVETGRIPM